MNDSGDPESWKKRMEIVHGKLFVGGISWDTNEDRLREYFRNFGDVVEAVIMRDRATGRARGFGFIVFADPAVAERVVQEKHMIDGRNVEAKKAVPRDDQNNDPWNPRSRSNNVSPSPIRTKKIFVGGLPSSITESDFKRYFDQFGLITDIVVMHDHNTQRPRGFGFITYDTEDEVDKALYKTFHKLKGKMVEVKRAVPKELSPGPSWSPLANCSPGISRVNSFTNGYTQGGYALSPVSNYGARPDGRVSPGVIPSFVSLYGKELHGEPNLNSSYGLNASLNQNFGYVKESNPLYSSISGRPSNNAPTGKFVGLARGSLWGNDSRNFLPNSGNFTGRVTENSSIDPYVSIRKLWGSSSSLIDHGGANGSKFDSGNSYFGSIDECYSGSYQRNGIGIGVVGGPSSYCASGGGYNGSLDLYGKGLDYGDPTWRSSSSSFEMEDSSSFSYGLGAANADVIMTRGSSGYVGFGMTTVK